MQLFYIFTIALIGSSLAFPFEIEKEEEERNLVDVYHNITDFIHKIEGILNGSSSVTYKRAVDDFFDFQDFLNKLKEKFDNFIHPNNSASDAVEKRSAADNIKNVLDAAQKLHDVLNKHVNNQTIVDFVKKQLHKIHAVFELLKEKFHHNKSERSAAESDPVEDLLSIFDKINSIVRNATHHNNGNDEVEKRSPIDNILDTLGKIHNVFEQKVQNQSVTDFLKKKVDQIGDAINLLKEKIKNHKSERSVEDLQNAINHVKDNVKDNVGKVTDVLQNIIETIREKVEEAKDKLTN